MKEVEYFRAARVRIQTDPVTEVFADGEYICHSPVEIGVRRNALAGDCWRLNAQAKFQNGQHSALGRTAVTEGRTPGTSNIFLELIDRGWVYTVVQGNVYPRSRLNRRPEEVPSVAPQDQVLPTLFGEGQGLYPQRKDTFVYSFVVHMLAVGLIIWSGHWAFQHKDEIKQQVIGLATDISPYLPLPVSNTRAGGGGGGGDRDKLNAPKGALPKLSKDQIVPPAIVVRNEQSQAGGDSFGGGSS